MAAPPADSSERSTEPTRLLRDAEAARSQSGHGSVGGLDPDTEAIDVEAWLDPAPRRRLIGRWAPAAIAVMVIATLVFIAVRWFSPDQEEPAVVAAKTSQQSGAPTHKKPSPNTAASTNEKASNPIRIHVVGAVKKPGLYRLAKDAILADAVEAAGGYTSKADQAGINLAAPATDGTQVRVPAKGEEPQERADAPGDPEDSGPEGSGGGPNGGPGSQGSSEPSDGVNTVRINQASGEELQALPGVGPVLAQSIIDFRDQNGPLTSDADLEAISGIGPATSQKLQGKISYD